MDSLYRFLTLGIPWTQSMPSRDVNAATRLAETSSRRDKYTKSAQRDVHNEGNKILLMFYFVQKQADDRAEQLREQLDKQRKEMFTMKEIKYC